MPVIDTDTAEGKAALQKLIDAETEGLKAKRDELHDDNKKLKTKLKDAEDKVSEIESAKQKEIDEALKKSGNVDEITKRLEEKFTKQIDALAAEKTALSDHLTARDIDASINAAVDKAGVAPQFKSLAITYLKSQKPEAKDGKVVIAGKSVEDFTSSWINSDEGKHVKAASDNGGGGAKGSTGDGKADLSTLNPVARLTAAREQQKQQK